MSSKWDKPQVPDPFRRVVTNFVKLVKTKAKLIMRSTQVEMVLNTKDYRLDRCSEKKQHLIVWMWFMSHQIVPVDMQIRCKGNRLTVLPESISSKYSGYLHEWIWCSYMQNQFAVTGKLYLPLLLQFGFINNQYSYKIHNGHCYFYNKIMSRISTY